MAQTRPFIEDGILTYYRDKRPVQLVVDSSAWYAWLQKASTFTFCSEHGTFTAHKERRGNQRRRLYWRASHTRNGKVRRVYLGQSKRLTLYRLKLAAFQLFEAPAVKIVSVAQALDGIAVHSSSIASKKQTRFTRGPNHPFHLRAAAEETTHDVVRVKPWHSTLPVPLTPFIGRAQEVASVQDLLHRENVRLVTLTGPGGSGKTRMAFQVTAKLNDIFPDGVYFVNLAPISDPALVISTIAQTFALKEMGEQPLLDVLKTYLEEKQLLLLLDNFEQVASAASQLIDLLIDCPKLKMLVTSRVVLHVRGEQEFAVPPLTLPDPQHLPDLVELLQYEAMALFITRAQAVKPEFQVTNANAPAVAEICTQLDGLPLAIELAAARSKLLPPQALLARLGQRLQVLTSGAQDAPMRQQTLRNSIAWSYDLLEAEEQQLFRRLSVFIGGCPLKAIEAVCGALNKDKGAGWILDRAASLLDNSLLQQVEQEEGESRLVMLETIREYGRERLTASGEEESVLYAHADYALAYVEEAESHLKGAEQLLWLQRLDREQENLRVALNWLITNDEGEKALRFCIALWWFWQTRGYWSEGRRWLKAALALPSAGERTAVRARALSAVGELAVVQTDWQEAHLLLSESMTLFKELGDDRGFVLPLSALGWLLLRQGDYAAAVPLMEECITLCRELGSNWELCRVLLWLGNLNYLQGDLEQATALTQESLTLARELGDKTLIFRGSNNMGYAFFLQGNLTQAKVLAQEGLTLAREVSDKYFILQSLETLGSIALAQGDLEQALAYFTEGLSTAQELGNETHITEGFSLELLREELIAWHLIGLAKVAVAQGQLQLAVRLFAAVEIKFDINRNMSPDERDDHTRTVGMLRVKLGEEAFAAAWNEGHSMSIVQILEASEYFNVHEPVLTASSSPPIGERSPSSRYPAGLTAREVEVLRLVAQGLTDAQVAEQLVISPRTVNAHLKSIYSKIEVSTRSAATRYVLEHHLE